MRKRLALGLAVLCGCLLGPAALAAASVAPGDLDPSFGQGGIVAGTAFTSESSAEIAIGPEDETYVLEPGAANCLPTGSCDVTLKLSRYDRDGARDPSFGAASTLAVKQITYQHNALAVGPDGRPVVAAIDDRGLLVARFGRDGPLDPTFGQLGTVRPSTLEARGTPPVVAVQADGKIVVGFEALETRESSTSEPVGHLILVRLLANGSPDPGFGVGGVARIDGNQTRPNALSLRASGGFDIGLSQCCHGEGGVGLTVEVDRLTTAGALDPSLLGGGRNPLTRPRPSSIDAIAPGPGNRLYVAIGDERLGPVILRLLPNGALNTGFAGHGQIALGRKMEFISGVAQLAVDRAGRLAGVGGAGAGAHAFRLRPDGRPDRTFGAGKAVLIPNRGVNVGTPGFGLQSGGRMVAITESGFGASKAYQLDGLNAGSSRVRCLGKLATIVGTAAEEKIVGTQGRDVIAAMGGADTVRGMGGDDLICGGKGRDRIFGGAGHNRVRQ
jgi:uncharacterized delta-60 repeat protein